MKPIKTIKIIPSSYADSTIVTGIIPQGPWNPAFTEDDTGAPKPCPKGKVMGRWSWGTRRCYEQDHFPMSSGGKKCGCKKDGDFPYGIWSSCISVHQYESMIAGVCKRHFFHRKQHDHRENDEVKFDSMFSQPKWKYFEQEEWVDKLKVCHQKWETSPYSKKNATGISTTIVTRIGNLAVEVR